jgi:hypothetical protein
MYNNTAPDADSIYGIGKGQAQVVDLSPLRENAKEENRLNYAKKEADEKRKAARVADIYSNLGDLDKYPIYSGHRPEFAQKQKELRDYVVSNIGALRAGDDAATMKFQDMASEIRTNAELSKNFREQKERLALDIAKDPKKYRPEAIDYFTNSGRNADGTISYELDPAQLKTNTNLFTDFKTNVRPIIEDMAKGKSYSYTDADGNQSSVDINNFDEKHAKDLLRDQIGNRPEIAEQAAYEYSKLPEEDQNKYADFTEYYVDKMLPMAIVDQNKTVVKKAEDKKYTFKDGAWSNDTYSWTYNEGKVADNAEPAPGFSKGDTYQEISLSNRKSEADNKPIALTQANGATLIGVPKGIIKKDGWDMWRVAVEHTDKNGKVLKDKNGKAKIAYVPIKNNTGKIQGEYGFNVYDAIKEVDKGKTSSDDGIPVITSQAAYDALPKGAKYKHGDKVLTKK